MILCKKIYLFILLFFIFPHILYSKSPVINLRGLRVFNEAEIRRILNLDLKNINISNVRRVIYKIKSFYLKNGYPLVEVYNLAGRDENVSLFIDEGRVGKIVVSGLSTYYALKVKQILRFPGKVYNLDVLDINKAEIMENFSVSEVIYELRKVRDYSGNFFQLDKQLSSIEIMDFSIVKLFDNYSPAYDLYIHVKKKNGFMKSGGKESDSYWGLGLRMGFPAEIKPRIYYRSENFFFDRDRFRAEISAGMDMGYKKVVKIPPVFKLDSPEYTFSRLKIDYTLFPVVCGVLTPMLKSDIYHSGGSREDIGFSSYRYLKINEVLAPGFTLLNKFNFYAGLGYEMIGFHEKTYEEFSEEYGAPGQSAQYPYVEAELKLDTLADFIGLRKSRELVLKYNEFFTDVKSREFELRGLFEKEFDNLSIISLKFRGNLMFLDVPFYHQNNVNSDYFKGFTGKGYYSNKQVSLSLEYRFSLYQDYFYGGIFADYTEFESYGEILEGNKRGVVAGPLFRVLFYYQFEFMLYWGWDRLMPEDETQGNLKMRLVKKW